MAPLPKEKVPALVDNFFDGRAGGSSAHDGSSEIKENGYFAFGAHVPVTEAHSLRCQNICRFFCRWLFECLGE